MRPLSDLGEFRRLSAALSYLLMAASRSAERVLDLILDHHRLPAEERDELIELIDYVLRAWAGSRRRLGPAAALHPLRATALLTKALGQVRKIDLAVMLLHDKVEDVNPQTRAPEEWTALEDQYRQVSRRLDPQGAWDLNGRLQALSRLDRMESYCAYLGRLLDAGRERPDIVRSKLTDRLDNTLDFSIEFRDPLDDVDFFEQAFQCLYVPYWSGPPNSGTRPTPLLELSWRLYGLYKNIVLLSLLRSAGLAHVEPAGSLLTESLIDASLKEAQRIALELLTDHHEVVADGRESLREVMEYCQSGLAFRVTGPGAGHALDGLLVNTFDTPDPDARVQRLERLADTPRLLFEGAMTFLAMFAAFREDRAFSVRGIGPGGVHPAD